MSRRFSIGADPASGAFLAVMKDAADDPLTTDDSDYGKFLFNSRTTELGYFKMSRVSNYKDFTTYPIAGGTPSSPAVYRFPGGSTESNFDYKVHSWYVSGSGTTWQTYYTALSYITSITDFPPIVEIRYVKELGTTTLGPKFTWELDGTGAGGTGTDYCGHYDGSMPYTGGGPLTLGSHDVIGPIYRTETSEINPITITVWDLPANSDSLPDDTGTPTSGDHAIQIGPSLVMIAKPGHTVESASGRQAILSSDRVPSKIMKAGEITIAVGGTTTVYVPLALSLGAYIDYHVSVIGQNFTHPPFVPNGIRGETYSLGLSYKIYSDRVEFSNSGSAGLALRYMICADDFSAPSTGGSGVFIKGNDGTQDYQQIKKPGSSDASPNLNDILLDTRLAYVPIIAEGYFTTAAMTDTPTSASHGSKAKIINFANDGSFKPFVKYVVHRASEWLTPYVKLCRAVTYPGTVNEFASNESAVCVLTDTSAKFHLSPGNLGEFYVKHPEDVIATRTIFGNPTGLRYYIFGIPTSL